MSLECHTNILPLRVFEGVAVVFDVTRLCCEDGVIAAHCAVLSRKPVRPTLAKDNVTGDHVFFCRDGEIIDDFFVSTQKKKRGN